MISNNDTNTHLWSYVIIIYVINILVFKQCSRKKKYLLLLIVAHYVNVRQQWNAWVFSLSLSLSSFFLLKSVWSNTLDVAHTFWCTLYRYYVQLYDIEKNERQLATICYVNVKHNTLLPRYVLSANRHIYLSFLWLTEHTYQIAVNRNNTVTNYSSRSRIDITHFGSHATSFVVFQTKITAFLLHAVRV